MPDIMSEDFAYRPSWCDARLALQQVRKGRANGCIPALWFRSMLQRVLWRMGVFMHSHAVQVLFLGVLVFSLFCIGLRGVEVETSLEKLWVEQGGRLDDELTFIRDVQSELREETESASKTVAGHTSLSGGDGLSYQMLIQTPLSGRDNTILTTADFLAHLEMMQFITKMKVFMFGRNWTMSDFCYKPAAPIMDGGFAAVFSSLIEAIIPCVIISPLDCFWEGSKPLGPHPPYRIGAEFAFMLSHIIPDEITWETLNPISVVNQLDGYSWLFSDDVHDVMNLVKMMFDRMGIKDGYQSKPCLNPFDPACPTTAPNYEKKTTPDFKSLLKHGCNGMATKLMQWPLDLILGKYELEENNPHHLIRAEALESIMLLSSPFDVYHRFKDTAKAPREWSEGKAEELLVAWQRNFSALVYQSNFNLNTTFRSWYFDVHEHYLNETWPVPKRKGAKANVPNDKASLGAETYWSELKKKEIIVPPAKDHFSFLRREYSTPPMFHPLAGTSLNDMMTEFSKFNPTVIIIGYIIMLAYTALSLVSCRERGIYSCTGLGLCGCLTVTFATVAGLGCATTLKLTFNAVTTQIVPFLTLGLGVDDMFLLVHSYIEISKLASKNEVAYLLRETGLSAMLTSINNCLAFFCGGLLPVPALRSFCWQTAILLFFNMIAILTLFPAMVAIDLKRRKSRRVDLLCCIKNDKDRVHPPMQPHRQFMSLRLGSVETGSLKRLIKPGADEVPPPSYEQAMRTSAVVERLKLGTPYNGDVRAPKNTHHPTKFLHDESSSSPAASGACADWSLGCEKILQRFVNQVYAPFLTHLPVKVAVIIIFLMMLGAGVVGVRRLTLGLELTDVVPKGTAPYDFLNARELYFSFYAASSMIRGDYFYANCTGQHLIHAYRKDLGQLPYVVKNQEYSFGGTYWLKLMTEWVQEKQQALNEARQKGYITDQGLVCGKNGAYNASDDAVLAYKMLVSVGNSVDTDVLNKENLIVRMSDSVCRLEPGSDQLDPHAGYIHPRRFYNVLTAWYHYDTISYQVAQANLLPLPNPAWVDREIRCANVTSESLLIPAARPLRNSQFPLFLHKLSDTQTILDMIRVVRKLGDQYQRRGLTTVPSGVPFVFWEQYLWLWDNLLRSIGYILLGAFVVISLVLMSPWTGVIVVTILLMIVVELAGFMCIIGLKLNPVSAVILITAVGIGVEFTVHISLSYLTVLGDRNERMRRTLDHMFIPVLHGGLSTLLGIIMLAFSEFEFIVRYFFMTLSALIVIGLLNGLVFLPVLLSLVGPRPEVRPVGNANYLAPPTPPPETRERGHAQRHSGSRRSRRVSDSLSTIAEESPSPQPRRDTPPPFVSVTPMQLVVQTGGGRMRHLSSPQHVVCSSCACDSPMTVTATAEVQVQVHPSGTTTPGSGPTYSDSDVADLYIACGAPFSERCRSYSHTGGHGFGSSRSRRRSSGAHSSPGHFGRQRHLSDYGDDDSDSEGLLAATYRPDVVTRC